MAWTRASETDRTLICPGSLVLPREKESEKSIRSQEAAAWGTMVHFWKETGTVVADERWPNHAKLFRQRLDATGVKREEWWAGGEHEITFSYDCITGKVEKYLGPREGADAWKAAQPINCLPGTIDYLATVMDEVWVDDLKTGAWSPTPPEISLQLRTYNLAAWLLHGDPTAGAWASITHWPRYPNKGIPFRAEPVYFSASEMAAHDSRLKMRYRLFEKLGQRPQELESELVPGEEQCMFCPSKKFCPAWKV